MPKKLPEEISLSDAVLAADAFQEMVDRGEAVMGPVSAPVRVTLVLPPEVAARADRIAAAMLRDPRQRALYGRVTRSGVLRIAALVGIETLEERARTTPRPGQPAR